MAKMRLLRAELGPRAAGGIWFKCRFTDRIFQEFYLVQSKCLCALD